MDGTPTTADIRAMLREAIATLAASPEEQIRILAPGCVTCELISDFDHWSSVARQFLPDLSAEQVSLLQRIEASIREMEQPDLECFNDEATKRPAWQVVRELAHVALVAFGWEGATLTPFVEMTPGVWQRKPSPN